MKFLGTETAPLGMGCWPIGGAMYAGGKPMGYAQADDATSVRTLHAALAAGITVFDTAAAYGAGHSERLLAKAFQGRSEPLIVTKIGIGINEETNELTGDEVLPDQVLPAIDRCLARLNRDRIDIVLLHQNALPVAQADPLFDQMEQAMKAGKIRGYGWSTDFSQSIKAVAHRPGFVAVEHAMNVFVDAPRIQAQVHDASLVAMQRSPLAMGVLSGKYGADTVMPGADIRSNAMLDWAAYFVDGGVNPEFLSKLNAVRELLTVGNRTLVQGAIGWLWGKHGANMPIPGARTVEQIEGIAGALVHGALPADVMAQIETLIDRDPRDAPDRER